MNDSKEALKNKAAAGALWLVMKRIALQAILTLSNVALARLLFPSDFGTFVIVGSVITLFGVFSDLGFTPALIQKKNRITTDDIRTAFTVQLILGVLVILLLYFSNGYIVNFFNLGETGAGLLKIYSLIFLIDPFRQVPGAILERKLGYKKLVIFDLSVVIAGSVTSVGLAFLGLGVWSLAFGQLASHLVSVCLFALFSKWPIGILIARKNFISLTNFGISFQTNMVFSLFYGPLILLYLGKKVGQENLGYWQFAASLSAFSMAVSDIINRIVFPLGARLQYDKIFIKGIIETSFSIVSMTSLPIVFVMLVAAPQIIHFAYTDRWLPALPALYLGIARMGIVAYTGILGQILLALGNSKVMRNIGFLWAILTWLLGPVLIERFNFVGMSLTGLIVSTSGVWLLFRLRRDIHFSFGVNFYPYLISSIVSALVIWVLLILLPTRFVSLIFSLVIGASFYLILIFFSRKSALLENLSLLLAIFKKG